MAEVRTTGFVGLTQTNAGIDFLRAEFTGMKGLEDIISKVLNRLALATQVTARAGNVRRGAMTIEAFDGWFAPIVRAELGRHLEVLRARAVQKAKAAGAGSASSAVLRRMYKGEYKGNINIAGNRTRISSAKRVVPEPDGGISGIRRHRTVSGRTETLRGYYGPDRGFILRFLNTGTDVRTAQAQGSVGPGSGATYGNRGMLPGTHFFSMMHSDMEQAAHEMGETLIGKVDIWVQQNFEKVK